MLVTCYWPHCEDTERDTNDIKDNVQASRTSQTPKPSHLSHHTSTTGSHFDTTIVSQRVPHID